MKILIIQENGRHEKNRHYRECFCFQRAFTKLGHECDVWGLGHDNYDTPPDYDSYDLIIMAENYDETGWVPDLSLYSNPTKFLWSIDPHVRGIDVYNKTFDDGKFDLILQAVPDYVTDDRSIFFPNAFDDTLIKPLPDVEKTVDFGFCGNVLNRGPYLAYLVNNNKLQTDVFCIGDDMVKAINSYKIHFNKNIANDINYRCFETIGCGTVLLTNYHPKMVELGFENLKNCLMYDNDGDIVEKYQACINDPYKFERIAKEGYELSKRHTYEKRAETVLCQALYYQGVK